MDLASQLAALREQRRDLPLAERVELSCRLAKQLEKAGEYEEAREALEEFWPTEGDTPKLEGLDREHGARVLLRVGSLIGWLGSAHQADGAQESAKDLLTKSLRIFEELGHSEGIAEAFADLGICYWREGAFDEARINLESALANLTVHNPELKAVIAIRTGLVEIAAHRLSDALRIFNECAPIVESLTDDAVKGTFHNLFAVLLRRIARLENRDDFLDRALIEYAAAAFHFEQAGHIRFQGCVDINLGFLFFTLGRFPEAHQHLDRARDLFIAISDSVHLAQVNDTRARALLVEGRLTEAEQFSRSAKKTLEKGDERALLAEALTTHAVVLARRGRQPSARMQLQRAIEVGETAGDLEGAGRAYLTLIEELGAQTSLRDLVLAYRSAISLLKDSEDPASRKRLISCAGILLDALPGLDVEDQELLNQGWESFSLKQHLRESERTAIERALRDADGSVTRAARLLGFKHHQSLISLLNSRHKELLGNRSAVRKRRRQIVVRPKRLAKRIRKTQSQRPASQVSILHVEDHKMVANLVGELLTAEGWRVELCSDADTALLKLTGNEHYDGLITDNNLPGLSGLELVERVRKITHRRRIPIVVLSGDDIEKAAWRAGANEFLRKPEKIDRIVVTIERLLTALKEQTD
jgi:CheY-like chemotaxis protein